MENSRSVKLMGIVNVNDDSFYAGSRAASEEAFASRVRDLLAQGADIIDVGAVSSRPGSELVSCDEEWARLEPVLRLWAKEFQHARLSLDTFRTEIVHRAYGIVGDFMVNDISAGGEDERMLPTVGLLGLQYVAMHRQGDFLTMHGDYVYDDVVASVCGYFAEFARRAEECGVEDWILDPGFGFSKSREDCITLLERLPELGVFGRPVLVGISRKRMTGAAPGSDEALRATNEMHRLAVRGGASILRVHDVAAAREALL